MTREEHLEYCKVCKNQKFDLSQGIICGLTNKKPDFELKCESYIEDSNLKNKEDATKVERETSGRLASKGKRFANYIIDLILLYIFSIIFGFILGVILAIIAPSALSIFEYDSLLVRCAFGFVVGMIFYSTLEATAGKTIAKYITKTVVVDKYGEKPSYGTILLRTLCRFIPFEPFSFLGDDRSGWHDNLSGTMVVED